MSDPDDTDDNSRDYEIESLLEKFRRDNPRWTEEEIENYFLSREPKY